MSTSSTDQFVLGVDGGGSKTEAVLGLLRTDAAEPEIVATSTAGPSNLQRDPFAASLEQVQQACEDLLRAIPSARERIAAACFAMAGSRSTPLSDRFGQWIRERRWTTRFEITHDARPLIAAGTAADWGIAVIAGTGSFGYARTAAGHESYCGGWGPRIGDEGSAYWLAVEGMRHALYAWDGRGPETSLLAALSDWLGDEPPHAWPTKVSQMKPDQIARAAKVVTRSAEAGDPVSAGLVTRSADHLARLIVALKHRAFADSPVPIALAGGLLCGGPVVYDALMNALRQHRVEITSVEKVEHPSHGAAKLAMRRVALS